MHKATLPCSYASELVQAIWTALESAGMGCMSGRNKKKHSAENAIKAKCSSILSVSPRASRAGPKIPGAGPTTEGQPACWRAREV